MNQSTKEGILKFTSAPTIIAVVVAIIAIIIITIPLAYILVTGDAQESFVIPAQPALPRMGWSKPALGTIISSASIQRFKSRPSFPNSAINTYNTTIPLCGNPYVYWA